MSVAWFPKSSDAPNHLPRGAMAVGMLAELPAQECCAILAFRQWCDGAAGREAVAHGFSVAFPAATAAQKLNAFADLMGLMLAAPRRTLMRHGLSCACFGGDEAAFAHMISAATLGDREDAMVFALVLVQPDVAWQAVQLAQGAGVALLGLCRNPSTLN
jgi:hypothetical protein